MAHDTLQWLADALLSGSLQGAAVIGVVWLACRLGSRVPAPIQAALWWLAALKLIVALAPIPSIPLRVLPAAPTTTVPLFVVDAAPTGLTPVATDASGRIDWLLLIVAIWSAGVLIQAIRLVLAYRELCGLVRRSVPMSEDDLRLVSPLAGAVGLTHLPPLRVSDEIEAPMVAGIVRPIVIMPAGAELTSEDLRMAVCHELMHVRRRDLALGWVPALAERLFFFHPMARLAAREYVTAREAACDAAVVRALGVAPAHYGRLLVRLGIARPEPALAAGGAAVSMSSLRRRLDMLQHPPVTRVSRRLAWSLTAALTLALLPFQLSAKTSAPQEPPTAVAGDTRPAAPAEQTTAVSIGKEQVPGEAAVASRVQEDARLLLLDQLVQTTEAQERERNARRGPVFSPDGQWAAITTEEFLRAQVEALAAQLKSLAEGRQVGANDVEQQYRAALRDGDGELQQQYREALRVAEAALEAQQQAERTARNLQTSDQNESLRAQLEILHSQQQELMKELQRISAQQRVLTDLQQQIANETKRLRDALNR